MRCLNAIAVCGLAAIAPFTISAHVSHVPDIRIGIVGNPDQPIPWSDEALEHLKEVGFNWLQLNLAWEDPTPSQEPLTLEDLVSLSGEAELPGASARRAELKKRVLLARKHGFRTILNLASPNMARNPYTGDVTKATTRIDDATFDSWYDILNPKVRDHEFALLKELRREFPEITDILIYTYDDEAWQTPEFQYNPFSYGIPLPERLAGYVTALHQVWTQGRQGEARLWWEPWELSAGQTYAALSKLPRTDFGLIIHSSIQEVQLARPVDVWFRNIARMCRMLGIPVVAHGFFSSKTEELRPLSIPAPRLVDEAYQAIVDVPGIVGIKEYYGANGTEPDLNLDLLRERLHGSAEPTDVLVEHVTDRFGPARAKVRAYLGLLADAIQVYPWDASWVAREVGMASVDHGWRGATINGASAPTPAWESSNHSAFMKTDSAQPHFWMLEDVQLRCALTAEILDNAMELSRSFAGKLPTPDEVAYFEKIQQDVDDLRRVVRSYALHLRETNVAEMLRQDLIAGRPLTASLVQELGRLLDADVANQNKQGRVVEMRRLYHKDPNDFVRRYLVPLHATAEIRQLTSPDLPPTDRAKPEKGIFTLTTR